MPAFTQLAAPVDVTPTADGTYYDVDVTSYVTNASGVLLHIQQSESSNPRSFAARKNGSSDDYYGDVWATQHTYYAVGIDGSDIFECKLESLSGTWTVELIGYFSADDVVFFDTALTSPATTGAWTDWDISSDTGGDTAIAAICASVSSGTRNIGFRCNGSTDNRTHDTSYVAIVGGAVVGVDGSEVLEYYREDSSIQPLVVGYFKSGVTMNTNASDVSLSTTLAWTDLPSLGTDIAGAFIEVVGSGIYEWGLRPDGDADYVNDYADLTRYHAWGIVSAVSDIVEGYIENTGVDFYLLGTIDADASGTPASISESVSAAETVDAVVVYAASISESVSASDTISSTASTGVSISESLSAIESSDGETGILGSVSESLSASDTVSAVLEAVVSIAESASASDSVSATASISASVSESGSASDAISAVVETTATIAEALSAVETVTASVPEGVSLTEADIAAIAQAVWDQILENGIPAQGMMRVFLAALAGEASGAGTTNIKFRDSADSKDRINAIVDSHGNRSEVTLDVS